MRRQSLWTRWHRRLGAALFALAAVVPAAAAAESLVVAAGSIVVHGSSTLHDWSVEATELQGSLALPAGFLDGLATDAAAATGSFSLPVAALRSEHERMTRIMRQSLRAEDNPRITFQLRGARLGGREADGSWTVDVTGTMTVAGRSQPVATTLRLRRDGARLLAEGELSLLMTRFGIDPPRAMLGTLRTGDAVRVVLAATLQPAGGSEGR